MMSPSLARLIALSFITAVNDDTYVFTLSNHDKSEMLLYAFACCHPDTCEYSTGPGLCAGCSVTHTCTQPTASIRLLTPLGYLYTGNVFSLDSTSAYGFTVRPSASRQSASWAVETLKRPPPSPATHYQRGGLDLATRGAPAAPNNSPSPPDASAQASVPRDGFEVLEEQQRDGTRTRVEGVFRNGRRNGVFKFSVNGGLERMVTYVDDVPEGPFAQYAPDTDMRGDVGWLKGDTTKQGNFKNGELNGEIVSFIRRKGALGVREVEVYDRGRFVQRHSSELEASVAQSAAANLGGALAAAWLDVERKKEAQRKGAPGRDAAIPVTPRRDSSGPARGSDSACKARCAQSNNAECYCQCVSRKCGRDAACFRQWGCG